MLASSQSILCVKKHKREKQWGWGESTFIPFYFGKGLSNQCLTQSRRKHSGVRLSKMGWRIAVRDSRFLKCLLWLSWFIPSSRTCQTFLPLPCSSYLPYLISYCLLTEILCFSFKAQWKFYSPQRGFADSSSFIPKKEDMLSSFFGLYLIIFIIIADSSGCLCVCAGTCSPCLTTNQRMWYSPRRLFSHSAWFYIFPMLLFSFMCKT